MVGWVVTYLREFVERTVGASLEFDLVKAKVIEHTVDVVKVACLDASECQGGKNGCNLEHLRSICFCE